MRLAGTIFALFLCLSAPSPSQTPTPQDSEAAKAGFLKKNQMFLRLDSGYRAAYAMGFIDGIIASAGLGAPHQDLTAFLKCTNGMSYEQVGAIIERYVRGNPERWQEPLAVLARDALAGACQPK